MATHHASDQTELERALRKAKPFFDKHGTWIIYGVAAILAIVAVVVFLNRQTAGLPEASAAIQNAQSASEFQTIADEFPDSVLGLWARLRQADAQLAEGTQEMYTDREAAVARVEDAASSYDRLIKAPSVTAEIRQRALIGSARAAEALSDGNTQPAIDAWKRVLTENPDTFAREYIASRIERLESDEARRFYTWFHKQNPKPVDPLDLPTDTGPTTAPDFGTVPETPPDFEITPSTTPDGSPGTESGAEGTSEEGTDASAPATSPETSPETSPAEPEADASAPAPDSPQPAPGEGGGATPDANATDEPSTESPDPVPTEPSSGEAPSPENPPDSP